MTWREVARRDVLSVYRSRTGTAVAAILALFTVLIVGLIGLAPNLQAVAAVGGLVVVAALVVMVFAGSPKTVALLVGAFTILTLGLAAVASRPEFAPRSRDAVLVIGSALSVLLPLVGLLGSYAALVGERETGSVRFLLGLPNSRDDAYLAKFLSRSAVVVVPLAAGMVLSAVLVAVTFEAGSLLAVLGLGVVSIPYALLFVGLGLTASAYADTANRAVAIVIGVFAVLRAGWPAAQWFSIQHVDIYAEGHPDYYFWIGRINPINAYVKLTTQFAPDLQSHPLLTRPDPGNTPDFVAVPPAGDAGGAADAVAPVATSVEFAAVVLLVWTVAAPLFGLWYFRRRDVL
jgi:ABC-2 type transport system permease protein